MPKSDHRVVLDTNILVRAFINLASNSGLIVKACERRAIVPLLSGSVLREYRFTLNDVDLLSLHPQLKRPDVGIALERLMYVSDMYRRIKTRFAYTRDPKDSKMIELAIAGSATHLISTDNDLLALSEGRDDAARRFRQRMPSLEVMKPDEFVRRYARELEID